MEQLFIIIILVHYLGDFILQTDWQAKNKSTSNFALNRHVLSYSLLWGAVAFIYFGRIEIAGLFWFVTYVCHFATDWITSRQVKKYFAKEDHHNGFVVIGFDQVLHYLQLWLTFKLCFSQL